MIFCFLGLMIIFFTLEGILRWNDDFGLYNPAKEPRKTATGERIYYGHPWKKIEFRNVYKLNSDGFATDEFSVEKSKGKRVVVLGDSFLDALHVKSDEKFIALVKKEFPEDQIFSLARQGEFFPQKYKVFKEEIPLLFGADGKYAAADIFIFCLRKRGVENIAQGSNEYLLKGTIEPIRHQFKQTFNNRLREYFQDRTRSRSHAKSLLSFQLDLIVSADLARELRTPQLRDYEAAVNVLFNEVVFPIQHEAKQRDVQIGFLYLPSSDDFDVRDKRINSVIRDLLVKRFQQQHLTMLDASPYVEGQDIFFEADKHYNQTGHQFIAHALEELLRHIQNNPQ